MNKQELQNKSFALEASPIAWYEVAKNLHENALLLYQHRRDKIRFTNLPANVSTETYTVNRSVFLIASFSLENLLKAFVIYENPSFIKGGRLSKELKNHKLSKLQSQCSNVPYKNRFRWVFKDIEEGVSSWARYPCGLTLQSTTIEKAVTKKLWSGYNKVFALYSKRLEKLLSKKWRNPYGEVTSVKFINYA